ncbi:MAG: DNA mismatch repair endonuclease MutL [Verrucomicrobiales bacterium]
MPSVKLLPEIVASQVAAGEVIERPAAVVKELVENSLDAQATRIDVQVQRGGLALIKVSDNGVGMDRDDALMSLERHATSKIVEADDLFAIKTLGFRGEALPSIASVSRFRMVSQTAQSEVGVEVLVHGGKILKVRDAGAAPGTMIEVRNLFFNVPARRKFLRTEPTEWGHLEQQLQVLAVSHPEVAFRLLRDDREVWNLPSVERAADRLRDLRGADFLGRMLEVPPAGDEHLRLSGLIGKPGVSRSDRSQQLVFVNGRAVENPIVQRALREAYHTALMRGQFPITLLFLEMDPAQVDANVHPAKREVRFRDGRGVGDFVRTTVQQVLNMRAERTPAAPMISGFSQPSSKTFSSVSHIPPQPPVQVELLSDREKHVLRKDWSSLPVAPVPDEERGDLCESSSTETSPAESSKPVGIIQKALESFRILGAIGKLYLVLESEEGLVLVDQHAAHERVLFEDMRRRLETGPIPSQKLLLPVTVQVAPRDAVWLKEHLDHLRRLGVDLEEFGPATFKLDGLPPFLPKEDPNKLLEGIIDQLKGVSRAANSTRLGEDVIAKTVCRHAIKANDRLAPEEMRKLMEDLFACELPYCCPHGRPTMLQFSLAELDRRFGRLGAG